MTHVRRCAPCTIDAIRRPNASVDYLFATVLIIIIDVIFAGCCWPPACFQLFLCVLSVCLRWPRPFNQAACAFSVCTGVGAAVSEFLSGCRTVIVYLRLSRRNKVHYNLALVGTCYMQCVLAVVARQCGVWICLLE